MKINHIISGFVTAIIVFFSIASQAQDTSTSSSDNSTAVLTNEPPTLKELMSSNNVVTNTVGIVLVKISSDLWAGKYEVTQDAYQKLTRSNPSAFQGGQNPVDSVSWNDAMNFCSQLTDKETKAKELPKGWSYRLPTEDEWKMLADDASVKDAVMKLNGPCSSTAPVGSLKPNGLGLYDTRGNVMEWVMNSHDSSFRVLKGGAWDTFVEINARPEFMWKVGPDDKKNSYGFRVVLTSTASN